MSYHCNNDLRQPLLSGDSSPESLPLNGNQNELTSSDEFVYQVNYPQQHQPNHQQGQPYPDYSTPPYPGIVNQSMQYLESFLPQSPPNSSFTLEYLDYPEEIYKTQSRKTGLPSRQVVENTKLSFVLDFASAENLSRVDKIRIRLKRDKSDNTTKSAMKSDNTGGITIAPLEHFKCSKVQGTKLLIEVTLNVPEQCRSIFALDRAHTNANNFYHLIINLTDNVNVLKYSFFLGIIIFVAFHRERVLSTKDVDVIIQLLIEVTLNVPEQCRSIFALDRAHTNANNFYHLIINLTDKYEQQYEHNTRRFKIVGRKPAAATKAGSKTVKAGDKRNHSGSLTSTDSASESNTSTVPNNGSPASPPLSPVGTGLIQAQKVVAEHIETKTLMIDGLRMGKSITSPNGDIAYHYPVKDKTKLFEPGEIVGLFHADDENGTLVIDKLTLKNSKDAALRGVIPQSPYLEAQKPKDNTIKTERICMMGVVPVQVVGSVLHDEALYASKTHPGCAVSGHHLSITELSEAAFIGYSFSFRKTTDENSIGFVQAGVSLLECAGRILLNQRLRDMEENIDEKIENIIEDRKRSRKCVIIFVTSVTILVILTSIFLWQFLMPGSAYRYYVCQIGRKTPHASVFFNFIPYYNIFSNPRVNGIEFTFKKLVEKTHHTGYKPLNITAFNITGVRYYLNIDRCAYGGLRGTKDQNTGQKVVAGADIFAVDENCFHAYYVNENKANHWVKYNSVSWTERHNIFCFPHSKVKKDYAKYREKADSA